MSEYPGACPEFGDEGVVVFLHGLNDGLQLNGRGQTKGSSRERKQQTKKYISERKQKKYISEPKGDMRIRMQPEKNEREITTTLTSAVLTRSTNAFAICSDSAASFLQFTKKFGKK